MLFHSKECVSFTGNSFCKQGLLKNVSRSQVYVSYPELYSPSRNVGLSFLSGKPPSQIFQKLNTMILEENTIYCVKDLYLLIKGTKLFKVNIDN